MENESGDNHKTSRPTTDRSYKRAIEQADNELAMHEIILAQVIMGDYELAFESLEKLDEEHRKRDVISTIVTVLYRKGKESEARDYRTHLSTVFLSDYGGAQIAVGAANRVPWQFYPFPDS